MDRRKIGYNPIVIISHVGYTIAWASIVIWMVGGWFEWWNFIPVTDAIIVIGVFGNILWMNKKRKGIFRESWIYNKILYPFAYGLAVLIVIAGIWRWIL